MSIQSETEKPINLSRLLRFNMHTISWLPCLMIFAVVVNVSADINVLELSLLSYLTLAIVLLSFAFMLFLYFRQGVASWFVLVAVAFELFLLTFTIISGNDVKSSFYQACSVAFIVMACDYYKDRYHMLLSAFAIAFSICVYLNFFHLMSHPDLWIIDDAKSIRGYLLGGNYNQMGARLLCAVGLSVACLHYSKWWLLNTIPVIVISIVTLVIVGSMTSLTGVIVFLLLCLIPSRQLLRIGIISLVGATIFFQVFVCFQGNGIGQSPLAVYFIEDVLGKDITFTNRTYLWDAASKVVMESPFFGYGYVNGDWYFSHMSSLAIGPHNYIWNVLINGGVILLALFTYICYLVYSKLPSIKERNILYIIALISVMFLMMTMESYPTELIFILLSLVYFAPYTKPEQISVTTAS